MKLICFWIISLLVLTGCDKFRKPDKKSPEKPESTTTDLDSADTDSTDVDTTSTDTNNLTDIPPIQVHGNELMEVAAALEAKQLKLEEQERDLIQREQMVSRLEYEALSQQKELEAIRKETQMAVDDARTKVTNKYKSEYKKLLKQWEKIKEKHKEFIVNYLKYSESENKDSLEPEIIRLREERKQRVAQLLKTVEGMNAQSCAMMVTSMTTEDAVEVMSGLSNAKSAEILSKMAPQKAAELAQGLMGPRVPEVPSLEDVTLPEPPQDEAKNKEAKK